MREKSGLASAIQQIIEEEKSDLKNASKKFLESIRSSMPSILTSNEKKQN